VSAERTIHKLASLLGLFRTAKRGPGALGRRLVRRAAHRELAKAMRRNSWTKP
jgi:hypothetical protein